MKKRKCVIYGWKIDKEEYCIQIEKVESNQLKRLLRKIKKDGWKLIGEGSDSNGEILIFKKQVEFESIWDYWCKNYNIILE